MTETTFVGTEHAAARIEQLKESSNRIQRMAVAASALELVTELWPKPLSATVTLETHQWVRLRRTLLATAELAAS